MSSWVEIIHSEQNTLDEKHFCQCDNKQIVQSIGIKDILEIDPNKIDVFKNLEYQLILLFNVKKNLKTEYETNTSIFMGIIEWLDTSNKYLCAIFNLPPIYHKNLNWSNGNIPRSSYKFCDYGDECTFYYKNKQCFAHHYVFNMIVADVDILLKYVRYINKNNISLNDVEILKCLNTLSFVITHMYEELCDVKKKELWSNFIIG